MYSHSSEVLYIINIVKLSIMAWLQQHSVFRLDCSAFRPESDLKESQVCSVIPSLYLGIIYVLII